RSRQGGGEEGHPVRQGTALQEPRPPRGRAGAGGRLARGPLESRRRRALHQRVLGNRGLPPAAQAVHLLRERNTLTLHRTHRRVGSGLALGAGLLTLAGAGAGARAQDGPRIVDVTAKRFEFSPNLITLTKGETVKLQLRSEDVT